MFNQDRFLCLVAISVLLSQLGVTQLFGQEFRDLNFTPVSGNFANPERGLYRHTETHSPNYSALDSSVLRSYRENEGITLILRVFYLEDFRESEISQTYLDAMEADFESLRSSGLKAVIRFAYSNEFINGFANPPFQDATPDRVEAHIEQLGPLLRRHSDVICAVQAGFVGTWGEWFYTDHFATSGNFDSPNATDWENRRTVVQGLLRELPEDVMVQLRTPRIKFNIAETSVPLSFSSAFSGSDRARLAHHNDCFLASSTDFGTYGDIVSEQAYLAEETRFLVMGGETCAVSSRSDCETAKAELERFHWSYLNQGFNADVLDQWRSEGCFDEIAERLGYRFELQTARVQEEVRPGGAFSVELSLRNEGYASPFNPRSVHLLLRNQSSGEIYRTSLSEDPRRWEAGELQDINILAGVPTTMAEGNYDLILHLPDHDSLLSEDARYAIRFANSEIWEASTGYNIIMEGVAVSANAPATPYSGMQFFQPDSGVRFSDLFPDLNPEADEDGNGYSNFLDYALGVDPRNVDLSQISPKFDNESLRFSERTNALDVQLSYQKSTDLMSWAPLVQGIDYDLREIELNDGFQYVFFHFTEEILAEKQYYVRQMVAAISPR